MLMVTGATGYVGSALVRLAVAEDRAVRAVVRDAERARALLPAAAEVVVAALDDVDALTAAAEGCSAAQHLAGLVGGTAEDIRRANVDGTRAVLAAARKAGVGRFVGTGTSAAVIDADGLVAEQPTGPPALSDPYSVTKAEAEALVLGAADDGFSTSVASPVGVYGPSPLGPQSYTGLMLAAARGELDVVVDSRIGWVLAEDVARGHLLVADRGEPGRRYLLSGETATFGEVLHAFADRTGGRRVDLVPPGTVLPPDAHLFARRSEVYGHFAPVRVDDRGARALGFTPAGVDEGLDRTVAWLAASGPVL